MEICESWKEVWKYKENFWLFKIKGFFFVMDVLFISGFVLRSMYTFLEHYYGDADYEHCSLQSLACMYYTLFVQYQLSFI